MSIAFVFRVNKDVNCLELISNENANYLGQNFLLQANKTKYKQITKLNEDSKIKSKSVSWTPRIVCNNDNPSPWNPIQVSEWVT